MVAAICRQVSAQEIGIAAFNLAWAGTLADFENHVKVCSSPQVKWCNARSPNKKEAEECQAKFDSAAGGADKARFVPPCNAYDLNAQSPSYDSKLYKQKIDGLKTTIDRLISDQKVDVIAFQEVRSDEVLRTMLGQHASEFETCTAPHSSFQTVGFAWRKAIGSSMAHCVPEKSLSVREREGVYTRPGLALFLKINGKNLSVLNVHLKSNCANLVDTKRFKGHLLTDDDSNCKVLNRQVAPLEEWMENISKISPQFVVLGDFNRRVDEELSAGIPPEKVRQDGSSPAGPNKVGASGEVKSQYLWQEISDGSPNLVQVPLAKEQNGACGGFVGLDHILLSPELSDLQPKGLTSVKSPVSSVSGQKIETSDHCPRVAIIEI
ncbi:endonuclease/exonuclease/phosphatase family protein [Pseudomonas peradeniyensis]|uniref:Endonuclease/exonuclease/phosphatase family protein n=1 Tax=Pseudomonas peradeniyensis TaxID=2745488 RepID=A0ABT2V788_9PSED|nr:endonuclease/exonuclease/phosphatase family protein [Pseudomonas peradeniyensis]